MGYDQALPQGSQIGSQPADVLICVEPTSFGFLRFSSTFPPQLPAYLLRTSDDVFDRLWHDPEAVATVVLDSCSFDFEELLYASLNHTHVSFVVRPLGSIDDAWWVRLAARPNISLPCTDFMVWKYAFSSVLSDRRVDVG